MTRALFLLAGVAAAALATSRPACAQLSVTDPGSYVIQHLGIANQVKDLAAWAHQAEQMTQDYQQLEATYQALAHVTDLGSAVGALGVLGIRNPLPVNPHAVQSLLNGSGGVGGMSSNIGSLFAGTSLGNQVYSSDTTTWLGRELNHNGSGIAGAQSLALELYRAAADRMSHLDDLRDQINTASDPSTRESLIAQIGAEQSAIQNQQVQASVLGNYMQAQLASQSQRVHEKRQNEIDQVLADAQAHGVSVGGNTTGGSVANSGSGRSDRRSPKISGGNSEQAGNKGSLCPHIPTADVVNLPLSDHRHHFVASKCPSGRGQATEAEPRSHQPFDPAMILLDDVVQVFALAQPREAPQLARALHVGRRTWIGRVLVHRDRTWVHGVRLGQRPAEEPLGRIGISPGGQQEVDRLAEAVDRAIQVGPDTFDLDVGLVHAPGPGAWPQMAPDALFELGGIGLHPPEQGGVVDRDTPVRQHGGEIAIADREGQVPPQCPQDHLGREMPPLEGPILPHRHHTGPINRLANLTLSRSVLRSATEPRSQCQSSSPL